MGKADRLLLVPFILSVLRSVELRENKGVQEDTGDPNNDFIAAYLEYEEPEYNQKKGMTADDFTDDLVGYQTRRTHARSIGWKTSGFGEISFAALLVNQRQRNRYCMGTAVTDTQVVTPCGCVRSRGFKDHGNTDYDIKQHPELTRKLYKYDIGPDEIDVVANHVEFIPSQVGRNIYPRVSKVRADKCFEIWNADITVVYDAFGFDESKVYQQLFIPAIVEITGSIAFEAPTPWPPFRMNYNKEGNFTVGNTLYNYYNNTDTDTPPVSGVISSFKFIPFEDINLSKDNDGRNKIKTDNRLVNLDVEVCSQDLCSSTEMYRQMNHILYFGGGLDYMHCWCDRPWLNDEEIFQNVKDDQAPVYFKSVYGGIIGAPVVRKGEWVAWIVERVTRTVSRDELRATWSRGLDDGTVAYLESKIPYLETAFRPKINDANRLRFAIHDLKSFVPDADLKREDLDLLSWAQVGEGRFVRPKKQKGAYYSKAPAITSTSFVCLLAPILFLVPQ